MAIARNAGTSLLMVDAFYAKKLSAEMHLDTLSVELPEEAAEFKTIVASVPEQETAEHHAWVRAEIEREAAEWANDAPLAPDDLDRDEDEAESW